MPVFHHHIGRAKYVASAEVTPHGEGGAVSTEAPTPVTVVGAEQVISVEEATSIERQVSEAVTPIHEGGTLSIQGAGAFSLVGSEQSVSLVEEATAEDLVTAAEAISVIHEGGVLSVVTPGSVSLIGAEESVSLSTVTDFSVEKVRQVAESVSVVNEGGVLSVVSPEVTLVGSEQSVSLTESTSYGIGTEPTASLEGTFIGDTTINWDACGSSDPTGQQLEYRFDWTNNGTFDTGWSTDCAQSHVYGGSGPKTCRVQVRDPDGNTDTAFDTVNVP